MLLRSSSHPWLSRYSVTAITLLLLYALANGLYLSNIPGLLGDEASEGENVFDLIDKKTLTVQGERSYIGPLIDYVRIPFVLILGHNALALRLVMLLSSIVALALCLSISQRFFDQDTALLITTFIFFSPVYLAYQRLGWAITLIPFFTLLMIWLWQRSWSRRSLLVGLVAGLGLSNHLLFLPTLIAIILLIFIHTLRSPHPFRKWLELVIGFWAGFGTQFAILLLQPGDQGQPTEVIQQFWQRSAALPELIPALVSGSSYSALYTGTHWPATSIIVINSVLVILIFAGLLFGKHRRSWLIWLAATVIHLAVLLLMIDRFSLRYFVPSVLSLWAMAGYGLSQIITWRQPLSPKIRLWLSTIIAVLFILLTFTTTFLPFLSSGGSTRAVALTSQRNEPAAAHVRIDELLQCIRKAGPVFSEDIHIANRLQYLSHDQPEIVFTPDASWRISYRSPHAPTAEDELCPSVQHFSVSPRQLDSQ